MNKTKTLQDQIDVQRNKGSGHYQGRIIKGTINDAHIKMRVSSIPNKFQNVIYQSNAKPAFGQSAKRFYSSIKIQNNNPGPGQYKNNIFSKIQSKKGSGFFASQTKLARLQRAKSHVPGPGSYKNVDYQPKKTFQKNKKQQSTLNSSNSTAILSSQLQTRDIFKIQMQNSLNKPSVGQYNIDPSKKIKYNASNSVFKSKLQRFPMSNQKTPPMFYEPYQTKKQTSKTKKMQTIIIRDESEFQRQKRLQNAIRKLQKKKYNRQQPGPGPGYYQAADFKKSSKSFKIQDTIHDRFGELKPIYLMAKTMQTVTNRDLDRKQIVPGHFQQSKHINSAFKSKTQRWEVINQHQMDPGAYNPSKSPVKKSHLINYHQKWI